MRPLDLEKFCERKPFPNPYPYDPWLPGIFTYIKKVDFFMGFHVGKYTMHGDTFYHSDLNYFCCVISNRSRENNAM